MLKFEAFNLPTDGLTRVAQIDHYSNRLENEGYTMVGLAEAVDEEGKARLFGVYRMSQDDALRLAMKRNGEAEKKADEAQAKARSLEHDLRRSNERVAEYVGDRERLRWCEALLNRAAERFGQAFAELRDSSSPSPAPREPSPRTAVPDEIPF